MGRWFFVIAGTVSIVAALLKLRSARRQPNAPGANVIWIGLLCFGAGFFVLAPGHTIAISEFLHVPNSARLIGNVLTLASAGTIQVLMLHLTHPPEVARPRVRRRLVILGVVAVAMSVLLLTAHTENETNFVERYATYTPITAYQLVYLTFLAFAVVDLIHLSVRYSRHVPTLLKVGLRMVAAGGVVYAFHTAYKISLIISAWAHWRLPGDESTIATILGGAGGVLIAAGSTLPVWWPRAVLPWQRLRQHRSYRRLEPLWQRVSAAVPQVKLAAGEEPFTAGDIGLRLYRRVIEIRDAQLILEPFADERAVADAEAAARRNGLTGDALQAHVEATALATALARWSPDQPAAAPAASSRRAVGDASLSRESRFLERVAAAFAAVPAYDSVAEQA